MADPDVLYHQARRIIAELELTSHGTTTNWESDGRGGSDPDPRQATGHRHAPPGPGHRAIDDYEPAFLPLRRRLHHATTDHELRRIIADAQQELRHATMTAAPAIPEKGTIAWRRAIANDDRPPGVVAHTYDCSRQHVHRLRDQYRDDQAA